MFSYLIRKTSTSVEKVAFAASLGFLLLLITNIIFDLLGLWGIILSDNLLEKFSPEQILVLGDPRQFEFLMLTLLVTTAIYVFPYYEGSIHNTLAAFYKNHLCSRDDLPEFYARFSDLPDEIPLDYKYKILRLYDQIPPLKEKIQSQISLLYIRMTLIFGALICIILGSKIIGFNQVFSQLRLFIGSIAFLVLLAFSVYYVHVRKLPRSLQELERIALLGLYAYYAHYFQIPDWWKSVQTGSWVGLTRRIRTKGKHINEINYKKYSHVWNFSTGKSQLQSDNILDLISNLKRSSVYWTKFQKDVEIQYLLNNSKPFHVYHQALVGFTSFLEKVPPDIKRDSHDLGHLESELRNWERNTKTKDFYHPVFTLVNYDSRFFNSLPPENIWHKSNQEIEEYLLNTNQTELNASFLQSNFPDDVLQQDFLDFVLKLMRIIGRQCYYFLELDKQMKRFQYLIERENDYLSS